MAYAGRGPSDNTYQAPFGQERVVTPCRVAEQREWGDTIGVLDLRLHFQWRLQSGGLRTKHLSRVEWHRKDAVAGAGSGCPRNRFVPSCRPNQRVRLEERPVMSGLG
jgi:hypothetical protein